MTNTGKVRDLTYKIEEYERQLKNLQESYIDVNNRDNHRFTLSLHAGSDKDLSILLTDSQASDVVNRLILWYEEEIEGFRNEIRSCLTVS